MLISIVYGKGSQQVTPDLISDRIWNRTSSIAVIEHLDDKTT